MQRQPPPKPRITFGKFANVDMRVAQVESAAMTEGTAKPCRVLELDVGPLGSMTSVGQFVLIPEEVWWAAR
jgi:tRNA-binding protein